VDRQTLAPFHAQIATQEVPIPSTILTVAKRIISFNGCAPTTSSLSIVVKVAETGIGVTPIIQVQVTILISLRFLFGAGDSVRLRNYLLPK